MADLNLRVRIHTDIITGYHWNALIDRLEAISKAKPAQPTPNALAIASAAAIASASSKKFSRRALFGFLRGAK